MNRTSLVMMISAVICQMSNVDLIQMTKRWNEM